MELTAEQIAVNEKLAVEKAAEEAKLKETAEAKALSKKEALRELSKELGINAFEPTEIKNKFDEFTKWRESQKTEQEKLQEQLSSYEQAKADWQKKELEYQTMLEASKLNIAQENLEDVMKLAGNDPAKLAEVIAKYPIFKSKKAIKIGVNDNNNSFDGKTEQEKYMERHYANNPYYKK